MPTMDQTLLGLIASLVAALIFTTRSVVARSDRLIQAREQTNQMLIGQLTSAVGSFKAFEAAEDEIHEKILAHLDSLSRSQAEILAILRDLRQPPPGQPPPASS